MKILELKFKNLNSLYGEWIIDFTSPGYISDGIFVLTGPTGSGKSTILDGISLALYGTTPRLGKISQISNEVMSRNTGECYAELTFESQSGKFRCHWSQHRARKDPTGNLIASKHEISDIRTGQILGSKKTDVSVIIEEKTGMDFRRFTRSILLAQGEFDTFLRASPEDKSMILEQITGTEIYTEISKKVHERRRNEKNTLEILQAQVSGINLLSEKEEEKAKHDLKIKKESKTKKQNELEEVKTAIQWRNKINEIQDKIQGLSKENENLDIEIESFKPKREKLKSAQKATKLKGDYIKLCEIRKQQNRDQSVIKTKRKECDDKAKEESQRRNELETAKNGIIECKKEQALLTPKTRETRLLDQQICERKRSIDNLQADYKSLDQKIIKNKKEAEQKKEELNNVQRKIEGIQSYLQTNAQDELLIQQLPVIKEQFKSILPMEKDIFKKIDSVKKNEKELNDTLAKISDSDKRLNSCKDKRKQVTKQFELEKNQLNDLLRDQSLNDYRKEKDKLWQQMISLKKITDLKSERNNLKDSQPCPLCGSKDHPYVNKSSLPGKDETEKKIEQLDQLIKEAEGHEIKIKEYEKLKEQHLNEYNSIEKKQIQYMTQKENCENELRKLQQEISDQNESFEKLKEEISNKLKPFGIQEASKENIALLEDRFKKWQEQKQCEEKVKEQKTKLEVNLNSLEAIIRNDNPLLVEKEKKIINLKKEYKDQRIKRQDLFGDKDPDKEEERLSKVVLKAEEDKENIQEKYNEIQKNLYSIKDHIKSLEDQILQRSSMLQALEATFKDYLKSSGFVSEQNFKECLLPDEEQSKLTDKMKQLNDEKTSIQARKSEQENALAEEMNKKTTHLTAEDLKLSQTKLKEDLETVTNDIAELEYKIKDNEQSKQKFKEQQILIKKQKKEYSRWENLGDLIASADGKKYRNFAQGLTFNLMISHANKQLKKITDRYLLIHDNKKPLELNVVDNYQAGEIRPIKNLSGGESFIVSLALALGLSKMASRKVRVDSLFLDEGFGTLDEDTLETALEALASLQQDGKLIGVISHVSALKERISTQIHITPTSGGRSLINGPGVQRI